MISSIKIHVFVISPKESQTVRTVCFTPVHFLPIQTVEPLKPSTDYESSQNIVMKCECQETALYSLPKKRN